MSPIDDGQPSPAAVILAARLTVAQHKAQPGQTYAPGTCRQCTPHGCAQLTWAEGTLTGEAVTS